MQTSPYGTWASPLSAELIATAGRRIGDIVAEGDTLIWGETRPSEGGRVTLMRRTAGSALGTTAILPAPFSARTRVHEYGGAAFCVDAGTVIFSNMADQRLYRLAADGSAPTPLTAEGQQRYADAVVDRARNRLVCIREDHSANDHEPRNEIVAVDLADGAITVLVTGRDFYASPRLAPTGDRLWWIEWDHPRMPWDGTRLCVADVDAIGAIAIPSVIAGNDTEAVLAPQWSPAGVLHFVSDRTGWWNIYRLDQGKAHALWPQPAEFGAPPWSFGGAPYGFDGEDVISVFGRPGARRLARIPADGSEPRLFELAYAELGSIHVASGSVILNAASPSSQPALIEVSLVTGDANVLYQPGASTLDPSFISAPEAVTFPSTAGEAHAFYYAPRNPGFTAPTSERPPLIVISHGGPTGATGSAYSSGIQFWTTRGFAVLDVNYGGSSGYGRAYRERLNGQWGIVDVDDCIAGARFLVARGDVDGARLLIRGGSAGGYTTLCALTFHDVFRAGASHYGIGDLEALAKDTHKFESRYLDGLVGPYPARKDLYVARSPIHHVDRLSCPMIFFQGLEDKVVPPAQAETMVAALRAKGVPVAYVPFEGEQHGFRKAENIQRALEAELYFYGRVLGFTPDGDLPPVPIDNMPAEQGAQVG